MFQFNKKQQHILNRKGLLLSTIVLVVSLIVHLHVTKPLPEDFPEPWKYRIVCFTADIAGFVSRLLETLNICRRVHIVRFGLWLNSALFSIRNSKDNIQVIDSVAAGVPIRVYKPLKPKYNNSNGTMPVIFYYHGGGFFSGSADILEPISYLLAKQTEALVFYIEFRLIPEHTFPVPLDDSFAATKQILKEHEKYNIDLDNVILIGDSAGGSLATVISRKLIADKIVRPKLKVLIYPALQFFDFALPSYVENLPKSVLGNIDHDNYIHFLQYLTGYEVDYTIFENGHSCSHEKESSLGKYVSKEHLPSDYLDTKMHLLEKIELKNCTINENVKSILFHRELSPLLVNDDFMKIHSSKYTYILTVGHCIVRDDGLIYVKRLRDSGLHVEHYHYDNLFHGIFSLLHGVVQFDISHTLMRSVTDYIRNITSIN